MKIFPHASLLVSALALAGLAPPTTGQGSSDENLGTETLKGLSLEQLMNLEVTIASRSKQKLSDVPGAVYVLTGEEIRRAGHTSIPEALRMVPGFYVSRWTTGAWDVTARGFSPGLSLVSSAWLNQLLVLVDGVVVYSPLFAGVWWPLQDIDIADVDRIEIIRGPGGILWGSNAVHGVVHVITKQAGDTLGSRVSLRTDLDEQHTSVRHGGTLGENGAYRVWAKGAWYDTLHNPWMGFDQDWNMISGGFRADWERDGRNYTVWSRAYEGHFEAIGFDLVAFVPIPVTQEKRGFQVYGSVENPELKSKFQTWLSTDHQAQPTNIDYEIDSFDVEYQREFEQGADKNLVVGGGWRHVRSELRGDDPFFLAFDPAVFSQDTYRAFALERIEFPDIDSELTLGLTVEHNDFTQFEVQPTARFTWNAKENLVFWGAVSRAVRTPSLEERTLSSGSFFVGKRDFRSEKLVAYEAGMRAQPCESLAIDLALFYNHYNDLHLETFDPVLFQVFFSNEARGKAYGAELAVDLQPTKRWNLRSVYSLLKGEYESKIDGSDLGNDSYYPKHQFNLRSYYDLGADWELDAGVYWVEGLGPAYRIAEYVRTDVRVGWHPNESLELFLGVQNLTDPTHSELDEFDNVRRAVFTGLSWTP